MTTNLPTSRPLLVSKYLGERIGEREEGRENVKETGPTRRVSRRD